MADAAPPDRLTLLHTTGVISDGVRDSLAGALQLLGEALGDALDDDTGQMLITHLAMAAERASQGEALTAAPENLSEELEGKQGSLELADQVLRTIERDLSVSFPEAEVNLVAIYIATLSEEQV
jgi:hypothetical protein